MCATERIYSLLLLMTENVRGLRTEKRLLKEHWVRMAGTVCVMETGCSLLLEVIFVLGLRTEKPLLTELLLEVLHGRAFAMETVCSLLLTHTINVRGPRTEKRLLKELFLLCC